ncbi:MAG: malectin domain-containing carbohydrate-binding protein [Terracidiphilus sp.]
MTVEAPESVDLESQRAELEVLLKAKEFTRAPTLANLLSYLCERLFAGEANKIKEYSVGVEVFHRGASFDQDSDSIVRVEANRLRKRLAEYYAGDGASHRLQITIPVGQYVPRFEPRPTPQTDTPADLTVSLAGGSSIAANSHPRQWILRALGRPWWIVAVLAVLLLALGYRWLSLPHQSPPEPVAESVPPSARPAESQFGLPVGEEVRILAGGGRSFVDHAGKLWSADTSFTGGTPVKASVLQIWRTQDPGFYRTSRQGQFRYDIPLKKGIYELRLHFAETVYGPESIGTGGEGSRIMTVRANGKALLNRFDVLADAGAGHTADVKVFPEISPAADGLLHLEFSGEDGTQAILSAIEILPGARGHIRPVRILARQTPYYSNDSNWWSPDSYFEGGQLATYASPVSGTDDPELYETERWGNFSYAIPASPGKYSITLYFAVRHGAWDEPSNSSDQNKPGVAHVFNVFCNGRALLTNFNLPREAHQSDVVTRKFAGLEPNAQGKLLLSFVPVAGYATVTGIEVLPQ